MSSNTYCQTFIHLIWATKGRQPLIVQDLRPRLYGAIRRKCRSIGADIFGIGGVEDHIHILITIPASISISELVRQIKGASSHFVTNVASDFTYFEWQHGYGAFTLHKSHVPKIIEYITNQEAHHRSGTLLPELEIAHAEEVDEPTPSQR